MANKDIPESVRRWYRRIGAKGGQAGKGTERRRELMRTNANIRWKKYKQQKKTEEQQLREIFVRPRKRELIITDEAKGLPANALP